ncbi:2,3-bisphosphoglycerate-dependent phosphoglycerate mutase [Streptococcus sp. BCA20]|jgi:phosphoglycerate mutase|uniref:Phosphoglycerate mutase family 5 n=2 Tax=Streptococcus TaxID=1301 RepID=A0A150NM89_STRMT|nr:MULTISPECIES: histidine phosphatase family protein [Streptococcus]KYF34557.1 Phosphoglycerate mutase family 5 [Streptococcus mitis]RSJ38758.1 2,3-bisphosphoglycerate-dependent phosphoglycerate mutase [Streptococcus sp. BCA20]MBU6826921.1 histidine phosphatase family protein [Streptococcus oralis]MCM3310126.1 histidine phosphatase family protein [Streptococcus oralis]MCP9082630.1 histidine phosphatase family protein [Streptococcus sp. CF10-1]
MKLYFVRHGRTVWNLEGRFQGASGDSPLLSESIDILKQLGQYLNEIHFDTIYSSDLPRAVKSAEIIQSQLQAPCPLKSIPDLREWQLGKLEGLKIATLNAIYPQQIKAFRSNLAQFDTKMFEAESLYSTTQRTIQFIKSLKESPAENILIVGHGANLTASLRTLIGYKEAHLRKEGGLANASLTVLETDDFETFTLERWNDTSYQRK